MLLGKPLLSALNRMGRGGVILDAPRQVLDLNPVAEHLLKISSSSPCDRTLPREEARRALKALLRASDTHFTLDQDTWVVVARENQHPLALHSIPLSNGLDPGPHTMVVLIDLDQGPQPNPAALQKIFGLTPAKAKLAGVIAKGETLADIATRGDVSRCFRSFEAQCPTEMELCPQQKSA